MPRRISEEATRKELIDPELEKAGWYLRDNARVKIEIPVDDYDAEPWNGVLDCCLYCECGEILWLLFSITEKITYHASKCIDNLSNRVLEK